MVLEFHKIQGLYTNEILKYEERVENTFEELMRSLRSHFVQFREEFEYLNIHPSIENIYLKIKSNKESDLSAQSLAKALALEKQKFIKLKVKD